MRSELELHGDEDCLFLKYHLIQSAFSFFLWFCHSRSDSGLDSVRS